ISRQDNKVSVILDIKILFFTIITIIFRILLRIFVLQMETSIPNIENCCISKGLSDNFYMRRLDEYIIDNNDMVFPHRYSFFHFVLFTSGDGSYSIDFTNFTIKPYSM